MLDSFGTDLTERARAGELDPVIGRVDEIEQTIEILSRRTKNNPVLVGEAGVGKTAIVEGLAQAIVDGDVPEQLRDKRVISLDLPAMLAGTRYRGDFEERLTKTMDEIAAARGRATSSSSTRCTPWSAPVAAARARWTRATSSSRASRAASCTWSVRRRSRSTARSRRTRRSSAASSPCASASPRSRTPCSSCAVSAAPTRSTTASTYTDEALRAAVELGDRYLPDRVLPDKAIDLIDQAGARLRLKLGVAVDVSALIARLAELEADKNAAVSAEHYEEASRLRDAIAEVQSRLDEVVRAFGHLDRS